MSDGPFACIKMRKPWRDLLEKADNTNFGQEELVRDLRSCLKGDWNLEIPSGLATNLCQIIRDSGQASLFGNESMEQLKALRDEAAGSPLGRLFIECGIQAIWDGHAGEEGVDETVNNTLREWLARQFRGVEEHCVNKDVDRARVLNVRGRLGEAANEDLVGLGRQLCGREAQNENVISRKQSGLDDGVPIDGDR